MRQRLSLIISALLLAGCAADLGDGGGEEGWTFHDPEPPGEGVAYDEQNPGADVGMGKADHPHTYAIPEDLPELERPEIVVSLDGLTVHLFDRATGFSAIYPTGVGKLGSSGKSYTPTGFYQTMDPNHGWYYIPRRYEPEYFGGFPFLRLDIENSDGFHTYGFHGPITYSCPAEGDCDLVDRNWFLVRDYVSSGCMRMEIDGIVEMFWSVRDHAHVPVTIQREVERDPYGTVVDVGSEPYLYVPGEPMAYGECGVRPDPYEVEGRWWSKACDASVGLD